jgi:ATP phosphoribosyltransferase
MNNLKIAIQKNGKLFAESEKFLRALDLKFSLTKRILNSCDNCNLDLILLRDDDIPEYVARGWADFGIVGADVLGEQDKPLIIEKRLNFGQCSLVLAVPKDSNIKTISDLQNKRLATSYPNLTKQFLDKNNLNAEIVTLSGSVEIAPALGLSDAIVDITQTGNTLKENGLIIIKNLLDSEAVLIKNINSPDFFNTILCNTLIRKIAVLQTL